MSPLVPAHLLRGVEDGSALPAECACCGRSAAWSRVERPLLAGARLVVPYCESCRVHVAADTTRRGAVAASSGLLALSLAAALPLVLTGAPTAWLVLLVGALSGIPSLVAMMVQSQPAAGHTSAGRAVWWRVDRTLACTSAHVARALDTQGEQRARARRVLPQVGSPSLYGAVGLAMALTPLLHAAHFPEVRVVNTGPDTLRVLVDGREVTRVESSVVEGPHAGAVVRIAAGRHHFAVVDPEGKVVAEQEATLVGGRSHLYAPASPSICFWIESTGYGRAAGSGEATRREPLRGEGRLWVLPGDLDFWFSPTPEAARDDRSTGGTLRALRQGSCVGTPGLQ